MQNKKSRSAIHQNRTSSYKKAHLHSSSLHTIEEYAKLDMSRRDRTSIPEVIYCENKSVEHIIAIANALYAKQKLVLGTRCPKEFFPKLKKAFPQGLFLKDACSFRVGKPLPHVSGRRIGIVSAGTTDITACEEAALVLESLGVEVQRVFDVGVAGIHRLFANDTKLRDCDVLIVAAGMEGALPSVIAGLYPQPIIALPTSVGYGTALSGFTALFAMLTSCAPGVAVVNIDNGVGAAAAAFKIITLKIS
ncbi:MAG: nickel pincer cofactor biosynthesis protein LarB [Ignavibacteriales bacterium]|nr:nickel pincer cofactor biosynthesis protein LarB [Ignavibacteriales bacterium]